MIGLGLGFGLGLELSRLDYITEFKLKHPEHTIIGHSIQKQDNSCKYHSVPQYSDKLQYTKECNEKSEPFASNL